MHDVLLFVDVLQDFEHDDGPTLLESLRQRRAQISRALARARASVTPIVHANDNRGVRYLTDVVGVRLTEPEEIGRPASA